MRELLLCTNNPMLIKGLYGVLRDDGYSIDIVECPAFAVQTALRQQYKAAIIDSELAGLSAYEAALIIKNINPDIQIIIIGETKFFIDAVSIKKPVDLNEIQHLIRNIYINYSLKMEEL